MMTATPTVDTTPVENATDEPIQVSVVMPVYNEARYITKCLESLVRQTGVTLEILVVDDGSTDATPAIIRHYVGRDPRVRMLTQNHGGPGKARNLAAQQARGEFLAMVDGDMTFAPDYLQKLIAPIQRGEAVGTFSKEEFVANFDNVWARCWNLADGMSDNRRHPPDWPDEHDVFRAIRRETFLNAQGFTSAGSGDDATLAKKVGALARSAPGAVCYHYNPESLGEAFASARWYGRGKRVPATWKNILLHTPIMSIKRSIKRAVVHRLPQFVALKLVCDTGTLIGLIEKRLKLAGLGR
jgi:Glycosyl transferase family 2